MVQKLLVYFGFVKWVREVCVFQFVEVAGLNVVKKVKIYFVDVGVE